MMLGLALKGCLQNKILLVDRATDGFKSTFVKKHSPFVGYLANKNSRFLVLWDRCLMIGEAPIEFSCSLDPLDDW